MKNFFKSLQTSVLVFSLVCIYACGSKDKGMAVCVFDKAPLVDAPSRKESKWLSSIALGEKVEFLGSKEKESSEGKDREYFKVKLVDGKEGWVQADFIALQSIPAVAVEKLEVYSRPDLSSITKKTYEPMDVVALGEVKGDWIAIIGKRKNGKWIESGWIKNNGYSNKENDIATAIFIKRALSNSKKSDVIADLKAILENSDLQGSAFEPKINEMLAKLETPAASSPTPDATASEKTESENQ